MYVVNIDTFNLNNDKILRQVGGLTTDGLRPSVRPPPRKTSIHTPLVRRRGGCMAHVDQAGPEGLGDGLHPPANAVDGDRPAAKGRTQLPGNWLARPDLESRGGSHG